jgi:hypothetical protein
VRVIAAPTKEDLEDKGKKAAIEVRRTGSWLLRRLGAGDAPPLGDDDDDADGYGDEEEFQNGGAASRIAHPTRMVKDAAGAVDGLTLAQRGLLMVVCVAIMLEPAKAIREDALWAHLHAADPERFPTDVGRGAWTLAWPELLGATVELPCACAVCPVRCVLCWIRSAGGCCHRHCTMRTRVRCSLPL